MIQNLKKFVGAATVLVVIISFIFFLLFAIFPQTANIRDSMSPMEHIFRSCFMGLMAVLSLMLLSLIAGMFSGKKF